MSPLLSWRLGFTCPEAFHYFYTVPCLLYDLSPPMPCPHTDTKGGKDKRKKEKKKQMTVTHKAFCYNNTLQNAP